MAEPDISLAIYRQHVRAKGAFKGEHRSVLIIKPSCDINVDDVVFSFMIMEKKVRTLLSGAIYLRLTICLYFCSGGTNMVMNILENDFQTVQTPQKETKEVGMTVDLGATEVEAGPAEEWAKVDMWL